MGARLKFWRRSRVPKKGSRDEADYKGSAACRKCRRAVLHDITVLKQNRVYFTASILTVQWLAHTLHKIVTFHRQPKRTICGFGLQRSFGRNILELLVYYLMPNKCKNLKDMKS